MVGFSVAVLERCLSKRAFPLVQHRKPSTNFKTHSPHSTHTSGASKTRSFVARSRLESTRRTRLYAPGCTHSVMTLRKVRPPGKQFRLRSSDYCGARLVTLQRLPDVG